ncbi:putative oxidoreductase [Gordonia araii NBRC 100433]|uniref:Putative oxidoreductase n=1 Tax=Gordonia araii NBRC 100433 TaxID=1073574 RepID=G7H3I7_9ACTN|nr:indolepyruvate ferredoxin oxidoreductase family protein [Gordonia araii]NNG96530.1 indolepyruvate ferredoxin oxidoreductase family protein [Gordonia araii NBRC 100433]GAB10412.1 putative oxidoreductase [Gordonia araii NBRC 100433]
MTLADDRAHRLSLTASAPSAPPAAFSLDDRYTRESGTVYLTGIQALVRMIRDRAVVDRRDGLRTASFISGYEGSPLAGYDLEIARRRALLAPLDIVHRPGLNEEIAATSVMGSQIAARAGHLAADPAGERRDGVVGYWYGKAPGLDRATDALRHANLIGTHPSGGAVALVGDDPGAKSSTVPCASEMALADLYIPILYPADSADILDFGVHAALMSRVSGLWTSLKISAHVADGASTAIVGPNLVVPEYGGLGASPHIPSGTLLGANLMELEQNQLTIRLPRAVEYARLNGLNQIVARTADDRIGIVAAGKTYLDVREALRLLGIADGDLARLGIRILKLGMVYPMTTDVLDRFIDGLDEVIVVEEKRDFIETMMRDILFRRPGVPAIVGKAHEDGSTLFSRFGELDVDAVTRGLADRLGRRHRIESAARWLDEHADRRERMLLPLAVRTPYFCSGCPHNSSTKVGADSLVGAGIGCHAMALLMDPHQVGDVTGITQMGGEGAQWIGMAPFVDEGHFVQNIGDGTFLHSGSLALRAAVASGENITYKLLYNGTVAMTGGQDPVGEMTLPEIVTLLLAEGVSRVVVTTDDVKRTRSLGLPHAAAVRHRDDMLDVQRELAAVPGVTVLVHDQYCAAEKRRKRKRGAYDTPAQRVMINERVCEGCGDCGEKSNCLSVHPVETEFGRKTQIDQSSCNYDFSCLAGDCPAFVTVTPGERQERRRVPPLSARAVPEPSGRASANRGFTVRVTGIGGTGVVTVSQILATAAVLDGHSARTVDMTGLAQKGGAVVSDLKVSAQPVEQAAKVAAGDCDVYLACDQLVATDPAHLKVASPAKTVAVMSTTRVPTGAMVTSTEVGFPSAQRVHSTIDENVARAVYLNAGAVSEDLFGDEQYANMLMVGAAYQTGAVGISAASIERAVELNGVAVEANIQAFRRGRQVVADPAALTRAADSVRVTPPAYEPSDAARAAVTTLPGVGGELAATVARRYDELIAYQSEAYAREYLAQVAQVHASGLGEELSDAVARNLYKLMAYKDEYEVARLTEDEEFAASVANTFGADARTAVRLHPPVLRALGKREKIAFGRWARPVLHVLSTMKRLRGTPFDPFGRTEVRRTERELVAEYRGVVADLLARLGNAPSPDRLAAAVAIAELPDLVRGYESIKMGNVAKYRTELARRLDAL